MILIEQIPERRRYSHIVKQHRLRSRGPFPDHLPQSITPDSDLHHFLSSHLQSTIPRFINAAFGAVYQQYGVKTLTERRVKIHIGEVYTASEPTIIETLLGSCVSVCLFDPLKKVGGMNHILLPGKADLEKFDDTTRYGINAMEVLINSMMKLGSKRKNILSKIFGGAHIIKSIDRHMSPGPKNVRFVEEFLELEEIPIISRNTGGNNGRKILFHTHTGDVFLKTLANPSFEAVAREESQYTKLVKNLLDTPADVELFNKSG